MLVTTMFTLTSVGVPIAFGSTQYFTAIQNVGQVKSFVDDLVMKLGTVSMRVALVLRSAEVQPVFQDLCYGICCALPPFLFPLSRATVLKTEDCGVVYCSACLIPLEKAVGLGSVLQRGALFGEST